MLKAAFMLSVLTVKRVVEACFVAVSLMILFVFMVLPVLVRAVDYNVGVKVGDWIKYGQFTVTWSGNGTEPSYITDAKKEDWMRLDVENVSGTTVALNETVHYNNGTQTSVSSSVDVKGTEALPFFSFFLIASNLSKGDPVTNQTGLGATRYTVPTINQTTTGIYAGASRNINLLETTSVTINNQTVTLKIYWDQSTGVMVELHENVPYFEFSFKATETNMWNADFVGTLNGNLIYIITGIVILIIVIAAALVLRRKKTSTLPPPPEPAATDTKQE